MGGTYRVNRRLTYTVADGKLSFTNTGSVVEVIPQELCQFLSIAHGKMNKIGVGKYGDEPLLDMLADGDHFGDRVLVESESS